MFRSKILGLGHYIPKQVVTNHDLEKMMDTTDEWIQQRSGIVKRHWVQPGETTCFMATEAAKEALDKSGLKPDDIDAIIHASLVNDLVFPSTANLIQHSLGMTRTVPSIDLKAQCSGFLYSLSVADAWIKSGMYKRVLVVASEIHSTNLDKSSEGRNVTVLFGDGAGAMILEATNNENEGIIDHYLASEGQHASRLWVQKPSSNDHPRLATNIYPDKGIYPEMDGKFVFKHAVSRMSESIIYMMKKHQLTTEQIDFVICHQANLRINEMVLNHFKIPAEKTHHTIGHLGNTTAATIPLTMYEAIEQGKLKRGSLVLFTAFGAGFTWGSTLLRY